MKKLMRRAMQMLKDMKIKNANIRNAVFVTVGNKQYIFAGDYFIELSKNGIEQFMIWKEGEYEPADHHQWVLEELRNKNHADVYKHIVKSPAKIQQLYVTMHRIAQ